MTQPPINWHIVALGYYRAAKLATSPAMKNYMLARGAVCLARVKEEPKP